MEIWKPIPGYEKYYEASTEGRIRSKDRMRSNGIPISGRILKPSKDRGGYLYVRLYDDNGSKYLKIHRLVALTFCDNPQNKEQVNHKTGIRDDNRIENIEWVTCSENHRHAFDVLGKKATKYWLGKASANRKLTEEQIERIKQDERSQIEIAKDYGVCQQTISNIKTGKGYVSW